MFVRSKLGQPDFRDADNRAAANVARAAKAAGVRRIVYLGGFVPDDDELSEHLISRAEVAHALSVDGGPDVVWLGAAMIIGSGSTSFEMLRYVGDRFLFIPLPAWSANPIDPISISDVLYYLVAAVDPAKVPAGAYDIYGPETTSYGDLLRAYARLSGKWRAELANPHHLADTDPSWAGGDALRIQQLARLITPPFVRPALRLLGSVPGPVVAAMRAGLDGAINLVPKASPA